MGVWERIADLLFGLLDRYDDQTVFLLVFIEECGVPLPLPGTWSWWWPDCASPTDG